MDSSTPNLNYHALFESMTASQVLIFNQIQ